MLFFSMHRVSYEELRGNEIVTICVDHYDGGDLENF